MAKNTFVLNGVTYVAKPFDFDMVCDLEDMGVSFSRVDKMPLSLIRAYFAICADTDKEQAAALLQNHMIKGGKLEDVTEAMKKEMDNSDFFRALQTNENKTSTESKAKKKESTEVSEDIKQLNFG